MKMKLNTAYVSFVIVFILSISLLVFFNIEKQLKTEVVIPSVDDRFKGNDIKLLLKKLRIYRDGNSYKFCINACEKQVIRFYKQRNLEITPFGQLLLRGEYKCPKSIKK